MDKWKHIIEHGTTTHRVYPVNWNECTFIDEPEKDQIFYRRKLNGKLKFINKDFNLDFDYLRDLYTTDKFQEVEIKIYRYVLNTWELFWTGRFFPYNGRWDLDRCTYEVQCDAVDKYTCLLDNWQKELNVLTQASNAFPMYDEQIEYIDSVCEQCAYAPYVNTAIHPGFLTIQGFMYDTGTIFSCDVYIYDPADICDRHPCLSTYDGCIAIAEAYDYPNEYTPAGWQLDYVKWEFIGGPCPFFLPYVRITKRYIRRHAITFDVGGVPSPPAGTWINIGATTVMGQPATEWAGPKYASMLSSSDWTWIGNATSLTIIAEHVQSTYETMTGARHSKDVTEFLLENTCPENASIVSDFFQWNPETVSALNYVTGIQTRVNRVHIYQMSDWINPSSTNPATLGIMKLKDWLDFLRIAFNVYWIIEDDLSMRIEHLSYFERLTGLDLTTAAYARYLNAKAKFEYKDVPQNERWQFAEQYDADFVGMQLVYAAFKNDDEIKYGTSVFRTDPLSANRDGFIVVAMDNTGQVWQDTAILSGVLKNNAPLSIANLMDSYHKYGRQLPTGTMNNVLTTFESSKKMRKQDEFSVPLCEDYEAFAIITTPYGDADIDRAEINVKTDMIKFILLYD